jgi:MFS family permease
MSKIFPAGKASKVVGYTHPLEGLREPGRSVWLFWVVSYALGGTLGSIASGVVTDFFSRGSNTTSVGLLVPLPQLLAGVAGTFVFGAILGLMNWFAIRPYLKDALWWPLLTAVGLALGSTLAVMASPLISSLLSDGSPQAVLLSDATSGLLIGLMIGLAQGAFLARRVADRAGLLTFVATSVLGWLGLVLLDWLLLALTPDMASLDPIRQIAILFLGFALAGTISGFELPSLLKKHRQQLMEQPPDAST